MQSNNDIFIFNGYAVNFVEGKTQFFYTAARRGKKIDFCETILFPSQNRKKTPPQELLDILFKNLLLILGISYWKTYCPRTIIIKDNWLTEKQAEFWNVVYTKGLGEFFYKNKIDFRKRVRFPYVSKNGGRSIAFPLSDRSLLLFGGGKDSIVSGELLRRMRKQFSAFSVNDYALQKDTAKILKAPHLVLQRKIDPRLLALNEGGGVYNGHVPASAIYAFFGLLAAVLYDFQYIVASHEKSASVGNVFYCGREINHQWSKSHEFEKMFCQYVKQYITPDVRYFSLLRSFDELSITALFSRFKKYFPVFSSCNANFRIQNKSKKRWCGACPKCAFVFAALAAYIPKREIVGIFNKNLFADASLIPSYEALLGVRGIKPFECVGTPREVKRAFFRIIKRGEFNGDAVLSHVRRNFL
ncbi:MAG: endonuclease domain-containing protein [Candidatus Colwellbacteria bacterium]|nr:endonuclease domain-containing protein [Candidatus Colwellbacteria bacterium]